MFGTCLIHPSEKTDIPTVTLASVDGLHSCSIFTYGATVISWINNGKEKLFVSTEAYMDGSKAVRGGIPLVFPQFAQPNPAMAQHGFARNQIWEILGSFSESDSISAILRCKTTEETRALWPHDFCLLYQITLSATKLITSFAIYNPNDNDIDFQCLQHTYLRIPHITTVAVSGLQGREFVDKMRAMNKYTEENDTICFREETDRIYVALQQSGDQASAPSVVNLVDAAIGPMMKCTSGVHRMEPQSADVAQLLQTALIDEKNSNFWIEYTGQWLHSPIHEDIDVVVWNPWEAKAKALVDLNDDGYFDFVCIEPGLVSQPTKLAPLSLLLLTQILEVSN